MNALRIRTNALCSPRQYIPRLPQTVVALRESRSASYSSNPVQNVPENAPHTPDTYQKDEDVSPPASLKTHVVSEHQNEEPRTQRPFELPTGSYVTIDSTQPYELPTNSPEEEQSKLGHGGTKRSGGSAKGVYDGDDGPQGETGRKGRQ